jgi:hypothetical protein
MKHFLNCIILTLLLFSCSEHVEEKETISVGREGYEQDEFEVNALKGIKSHAVEGLTKKTFHVANRTHKMTQYACTNCHTEALTESNGKRSELMHVDIKLNHASSEVMDCRHCHNSNDINTLKLNSGKTINFNESYKLCMQCHFQQGKDWVGGAHGKRLHSWQGKRVILNCTECHNPHAPSFKQRFPKGRPLLPVKGH